MVQGSCIDHVTSIKVNPLFTRWMSTGPPFWVATIGSPCAAACMSMNKFRLKKVNEITLTEVANLKPTSIKVRPKGSTKAGFMKTPWKKFHIISLS